MIEHCALQGGDVLKFGGDALLVWFVGDGHATRACRAAVGMRRTIRRRRTTSDGRLVRLAVSIGVHSGRHHLLRRPLPRVTTSSLSGPGGTETVDAESAADAGEILLSPATAAMVPATWLGAARPEGVTLARLTTAQPAPAAEPRTSRGPAAVERLRVGRRAGAGHGRRGLRAPPSSRWASWRSPARMR